MNKLTSGAGLEGTAWANRGLQDTFADDSRKAGSPIRGLVYLGLFFALVGWNAGLHWPDELWMSFKDLFEDKKHNILK